MPTNSGKHLDGDQICCTRVWYIVLRFALFHALNGTSLHTLEEIASDLFPGTIWEHIVYDGSY